MKKATLFLLFILPLLLACGTGSGSPTEDEHTPESKEAIAITLVAQDIAYDNPALEGKVGHPIKVDFSNQGALEHDFTIDEIEVSQEEAGHGSHEEGVASDSDLHVHLETGEAATFTFTPLKAGSYTFYCSVPGHREAGMEGTLTVSEESP